jgi:tRNA nucleotidyltransferase (CCA-adding enzyme)
MSDYMFMLDSHLSAEQRRVVAELETAAASANLNLFLVGGAIRDMLGGYPTRDLDFVVEGNALKFAKSVADSTGAAILHTDDNRRLVELLFAGSVYAQIAMARQEKYGRPGTKPHISPATIYEDLRNRDFTINAIALSLNRASRGLLLDPTNGASDLERHELRTVSSCTFYDDPIRLLRLLRLRTRFGYTVAERTQSQYNNAREAGVEKHISAAALLAELRHIASEPNPAEVLRVLDEEKFLSLYSPLLAGPRLNMAGLQKIQKAKSFLPFGTPYPMDDLALLLVGLAEKLTPKERAQLASSTGMDTPELLAWQKLEARTKKLESAIVSAKLQKPSRVWHVLSAAPGEDVVLLLSRTTQRLAQDRIKNFFQKYLPMSLEVTDRDVEEAGGVPGSKKWDAIRLQVIAARLDARPKKVIPPPPPPEIPEPVPVAVGGPRARGTAR